MTYAYNKDEWKCFTIKVRPNELAVLNQRLKLYGYETMTELTKDFMAGRFPPITEDPSKRHGPN